MNESEKKLKEINQGPGSSIWLSSLLLTEEGYVLNTQGFTDMIKVRYGYHLHRLSETCVLVHVFVCLPLCVCVCVCVWGQKFNVHTLSCKKGGFITIWHNQVTGTTTNLLKIICTDVKTETPLLPLSGESLSERTGNIQYSACADLRAIWFWIAKEKTFFWRYGFQSIT